MGSNAGRWVRLVGGVALAVAMLAGVAGPAAAAPLGPPTSYAIIPGQRTKDTPAPVMFEGRVWLFVRGADNTLHYTRRTPSGWKAWASVPGGRTTKSAPAVVQHDDQLHVFIRAADDTLQYTRWDGTRWLAWKTVPGDLSTVSAPAAAIFAGEVHVIIRALDGTIQQTWRSTGSWHAWQEVASGGFTDRAPAAAATGDTLFVVVHGNSEPVVYDTNRTDVTDWTAWNEQVGTDTPSAPSAAYAEDTIWLLLRATDGTASYTRRTATGWEAYQPMPVVRTASTPAALGFGIHTWVFYRDGKNRIRAGRS